MKTKEKHKSTATGRVKKNIQRLREFHAKAQPGKCYTLAEIARGVGVSGESVRKWQESALMKLRKRLSCHDFKEIGIDLKDFLKTK